MNVLRVLRDSTERLLEIVALSKRDESTQAQGQDEFQETFLDTVRLLERFDKEREELVSFLEINFIMENGKHFEYIYAFNPAFEKQIFIINSWLRFNLKE